MNFIHRIKRFVKLRSMSSLVASIHAAAFNFISWVGDSNSQWDNDGNTLWKIDENRLDN